MDIQYFANHLLQELASKSSMRVGVKIKHPDGRTVKIVDGQYLSNGRVSNHWSWKEVLPDGGLSKKIESGYGW